MTDEQLKLLHTDLDRIATALEMLVRAQNNINRSELIKKYGIDTYRIMEGNLITPDPIEWGAEP